jgi:hypothetical protein
MTDEDIYYELRVIQGEYYLELKAMEGLLNNFISMEYGKSVKEEDNLLRYTLSDILRLKSKSGKTLKQLKKIFKSFPAESSLSKIVTATVYN